MILIVLLLFGCATVGSAFYEAPGASFVIMLLVLARIIHEGSSRGKKRC